MHILMLSTDRTIFTVASPARERMKKYAAALGALDIIVYTRSKLMTQKATLSTEAHAYPTNSRTPIGDELRALRIAFSLGKPAVVSAQDPFEIGFAAWFIARLRGAKFHVQLHTDIFTPEYGTGIVNKIRLMIASFVIRRADGIRVISNALKDKIIARYHPRADVSVLPIFVDVKRLHNAPHDAALDGRFARYSQRYLVVARYEPEKNISLAIRAFAQSAPYDACLIILGDGSQRAWLEKQAKATPAAKSIFFEGWCDPAPYYALADVVLVPSRYEGYGLVIVEALAAGKPVISTDVGIAREAGAIVAQPEEFAEAIAEWAKYGKREAVLRNYPYASEEEYVEKIVADMTKLPNA